MSVRYTCGGCGYARAYRSTAMANYHHPKHSCPRELAKQAAHRRGRARMAKIDRTPKPCLHKIANHQHGTHACYTLDSCRCPPCARSETLYEQRRLRERAYGREAYLDAGPAREHARKLMTAGVGLKRIAAVSGLSTGTLSKLIYGKYRADGTRTPSKRITHATEARLLAVQATLETLAAGKPVDATGTHRRVQALVTQGWSLSKIGRLVGIDDGTICGLMRRRQVTAGHARAIAAVYDQLWNQPPPENTHRDKIAATRARRYAADRGYLPPLAWDDDTIDDPAAHAVHRIATGQVDDADPEFIDDVAVSEFIAGRDVSLTGSEIAAARLRLERMGLSARQIAERLGTTSRTVVRKRAAERAALDGAA